MSDYDEPISESHEMYGRIVYDRRAGQYYDKHTDLYLSYEDAKEYGLCT